MKVKNVLLPGFVSTSLMTLFSYVVSEQKEENFKEPQLLADLLKHIIQGKEQYTLPAGWVAHYSFGVSWAFLLHYLLQKMTIKTNLKTSLLIGGLSGICGIAIWGQFFRFHPPKTDFKRFYEHLLVAHLIYTLSLLYQIKFLKRF